MEPKTDKDQEQDIMLAKMNLTLETILTEVKKTNGRVTAIETWKHKIQGAYSAVVIVCTVLGFCIGMALTFILK